MFLEPCLLKVGLQVGGAERGGAHLCQLLVDEAGHQRPVSIPIGFGGGLGDTHPIVLDDDTKGLAPGHGSSSKNNKVVRIHMSMDMCIALRGRYGSPIDTGDAMPLPVKVGVLLVSLPQGLAAQRPTGQAERHVVLSHQTRARSFSFVLFVVRSELRVGGCARPRESTHTPPWLNIWQTSLALKRTGKGQALCVCVCVCVCEWAWGCGVYVLLCT